MEHAPIPELAADITPDELDKEIRDELRSLPNDLADKIASHLVAAERALGDDDPGLAYEHAKVARRFAARIGVVREAVGLAAYRAGQYAEALSDLRAARRLTGSDAFLPIMADCERGLGRPERALDLVRSPEAERLDREARIELAIVESGARRDLGQHDAAVITLQRLPELRVQESRPWSARLTFAYADALAQAGHTEAATDWFERAMTFDEDGETDAAERYAELTGAVIEDVEELDDEDLDELDFADFGDLGETGDEGERVVDDADADAAAGDLDDAEDVDADEDVDDDLQETGVVDEDASDVTPRPGAEAADADPGEADDASAVAVRDAGERASEAGPPSGMDVAGDVLSPEPGDSSVGGALGPSGDKPDDVPGDRTAGAAGASPAVKAETKISGLEPGMAPAFIEPDFGDVDPGDPDDGLDERDIPAADEQGKRKA
ncbi:tetratricopeptide repeat protein [Sphaerisporangium siamense]|uniref:Tetratricopeptide (TPR) repeat protein n=1 Tax=Sphaerisporangium siamense TaxID=795645 RepID=A0A7W7DAP0_9ACTN|nr:tetratricopeptide repeat protein [Sphaerisporangium siamense]MBB4703350.1 tetratricopeptide (TPR) repeat protein [Sphaerisporangium siamense]